MIRLWPLGVLVLILFGCAVRLALFERELAELERRQAQSQSGETCGAVTALGGLFGFVARALTRVAHLSGAALGFMALANAAGTNESPLLGVGCLVVGSTAALGISAWARGIERRLGALRRSVGKEMRAKRARFERAGR